MVWQKLLSNYLIMLLLPGVVSAPPFRQAPSARGYQGLHFSPKNGLVNHLLLQSLNPVFP